MPPIEINTIAFALSYLLANADDNPIYQEKFEAGEVMGGEALERWVSAWEKKVNGDEITS